MRKWFLPRTDLDCVLVAGRYSLLDGAAADAAAAGVPAPRRGRARRRRCLQQRQMLANPEHPGATYNYQPRPRPPGGPGAADRRRMRRLRGAARRRRTPVPSRSAIQPSRPPSSARGRRPRSPRTPWSPGLPHPRDALRGELVGAATVPHPGRHPGQLMIVDAHHHVWDPGRRRHEVARGPAPPLRRRFSAWTTSPMPPRRRGSAPVSSFRKSWHDTAETEEFLALVEAAAATWSRTVVGLG